MIMPKKVELDPVIWLDYIKLVNQELLERLERRYQDEDFNSPFVLQIFHTSYDKTLARDGRFKMIQKENLALFNHIVSGEFLTNELAFEQEY